jgi:hypothetical protein
VSVLPTEFSVATETAAAAEGDEQMDIASARSQVTGQMQHDKEIGSAVLTCVMREYLVTQTMCNDLVLVGE